MDMDTGVTVCWAAWNHHGGDARKIQKIPSCCVEIDRVCGVAERKMRNQQHSTKSPDDSSVLHRISFGKPSRFNRDWIEVDKLSMRDSLLCENRHPVWILDLNRYKRWISTFLVIFRSVLPEIFSDGTLPLKLKKYSLPFSYGQLEFLAHIDV